MENKKIITAKAATGELIGRFILFSILFNIVHNIVYQAIVNRIAQDSLIVIGIIAIILQAIVLLLVWKCSMHTLFKKRAIEVNDVKVIMKNLMIFAVILCFIVAIFRFVQLDEFVQESINSNVNIMMLETYIRRYSDDDEQIAQYEAEKEKVVNEAKGKLYPYIFTLQIGLSAVFIGAVPLQKRSLLKYAV